MLTNLYWTLLCNETFVKAMILASAVELDTRNMMNPIMDGIRFALTILCSITTGITGIRLLTSYISMATTTEPNEQREKKNDMGKALKQFAVAAILTAVILLGGSNVMDWVSQNIKTATVVK